MASKKKLKKRLKDLSADLVRLRLQTGIPSTETATSLLAVLNRDIDKITAETLKLATDLTALRATVRSDSDHLQSVFSHASNTHQHATKVVREALREYIAGPGGGWKPNPAPSVVCRGGDPDRGNYSVAIGAAKPSDDPYYHLRQVINGEN